MNPYAAFLAGQAPLDVIAATPARLRAAIARHAGTLDVPWAPGKWTPRQVLGHLAECEVVFAMRLRQAVAEAHHVIQPFDQEAWARANPHPDVEESLAMFCSVRAANLAFIRRLDDATLARPVTHPERGTMTLRTIVETMGGHDLNHLQQLER